MESATQQLDKWQCPPDDRLAERVEHLEGLMSLITSDEDADGQFSRLAPEMQQAVLRLAADLAHEIRALHRHMAERSCSG